MLRITHITLYRHWNVPSRWGKGGVAPRPWPSPKFMHFVFPLFCIQTRAFSAVTTHLALDSTLYTQLIFTHNWLPGAPDVPYYSLFWRLQRHLSFCIFHCLLQVDRQFTFYAPAYSWCTHAFFRSLQASIKPTHAFS